MKFVLIAIFTSTIVLCSPEVYAQNFNIFGPGYMPNTAYGTTRLGDAAVMNSMANMTMAQSEAYINYQTGYSMYLNNRLLRTRTYFENRQLNMYYRDLEAWQKEEKALLKRSGLYNREAIQYIYGK